LIRFSLLASGSKGNAVLVLSPAGKVLIDNGLSFKRLSERAKAVGESLDGLDAVFVTHEHGDHVGGVGVLARKLGVPVYITRETHAHLPTSVGAIPRVEHFEAGDAIALDGLVLQSYSVCHDAADPVGFVVEHGSAKLGIASDLGHTPNLVKTRLNRCQALVIEANYCPDMLQRGTYPPQVQQRIRGRHGHLSNADMTQLLASLLHDGLETVVLAHLSEENNTVRHAYEMASRVLEHHPAELFVARQDQPTRVFEVGAGRTRGARPDRDAAEVTA